MKKTTNSPKSQPEAGICQMAGPLLNQVLQRLRPPEEARRHFESARLEFLKGLRSLLNARIEKRSRRMAKGEKISVE
jgi:hypothetical protein